MNITITEPSHVTDSIEWLEKQEKNIQIEKLVFSYKLACFYNEEIFSKLCTLLNKKFSPKILIWDTDNDADNCGYIDTEKFITHFRPFTEIIHLNITPKMEFINTICWSMPSIHTITFRYVLNCTISWIDTIYYNKVQYVNIECSPLFIRSEDRYCYSRHFSIFLASLYDKYSNKFTILENKDSSGEITSLMLTKISNQ
jgi:hypothetical protein